MYQRAIPVHLCYCRVGGFQPVGGGAPGWLAQKCIGMIKSLVRFFKTDDLLKDSSILFIGMAIAHVFNLLFQMFMGRRLRPDEYALLISLLGVFTVLSVPLGVISSAISRYASLLLSKQRAGDLIRLGLFWGRGLALIGLALSMMCFLFPIRIASFFHLERAAPVYIFGLILTGVFCTPVVNGTVLGMQRYSVLSAGLVLGAAIRLMVGILLVTYVSPFAGWGLLGHGLGFYATMLLAGLFIAGSLRGASTTREPLPSMRQYLFYSFFIMLGYSVMMTGDVVLVKHLLPESAGDFAYAATLGRLVLFVPQALEGSMFPKVVAERQGTSRQHQLLLKTLAGALSATVATALTFTLCARWLPHLVFNIAEPSVELIRWFRLLSWVMVPVALLSIVTRYALAQHRLKVAAVVPLAAAAYVGTSFTLSKSPDRILACLALCSSVALLVLGGVMCRRTCVEGGRA